SCLPLSGGSPARIVMPRRTGGGRARKETPSLEAAMALHGRLALVSTLVRLAAELPAQTAAGPTGLVGRVREAESGRPLPAALVSLRGTPHRTLSDDRGELRLPGVAPGR